jgi:hypothetical protein
VPGAASLRVALVVEAPMVPAWIAALAARLEAAPDIDLEVFGLGPTHESRPVPALPRLCGRLDARIFRARPDALARVEIAPSSTPASSFAGRDVVLDFASADPAALAGGVEHGVWTMRHEQVDESSGPLYLTRIEAQLADGRRFDVYTSYGAVDPASLHRTRNQALWKAQGAFARRLETVRMLGGAYVEACPLAGPVEAGEAPSNRAAVSEAARAVSGVLARRVRRVRRREEWLVAARPRTSGVGLGSADGFTPIELSSDGAVADPFVFEHEGETFLFFEEVDPVDRRGHISYARLDADARPIGPAAVALKAPYHLSYPFVVRHGGEIFLMPESSANRTVELYRASSFPDVWTLEHVLLEDVQALDATLHVDDDRLWLFVAIAEEGAARGDELHLFSSSTLTGPWHPHPLNPVVSDVRSARPAGRLFEHGGSLIRPSQDSSRRYGHALVFNRVDVLTDEDYVETPVARIEPTWLPGLVATHTYNAGQHVEVIDGKRVVRR